MQVNSTHRDKPHLNEEQHEPECENCSMEVQQSRKHWSGKECLQIIRARKSCEDKQHRHNGGPCKVCVAPASELNRSFALHCWSLLTDCRFSALAQPPRSLRNLRMFSVASSAVDSGGPEDASLPSRFFRMESK